MSGIELMKSRAAALAHPGTVLLPGVLLLAVVLALAGCKGEDEFSSEGGMSALRVGWAQGVLETLDVAERVQLATQAVGELLAALRPGVDN